MAEFVLCVPVSVYLNVCLRVYVVSLDYRGRDPCHVRTPAEGINNSGQAQANLTVGGSASTDINNISPTLTRSKECDLFSWLNLT